MTIEEARKLKPGDSIHWDDPDEGLCTRDYVIDKIVVSGEEVRILDRDGSTLVCSPEELSS